MTAAAIPSTKVSPKPATSTSHPVWCLCEGRSRGVFFRSTFSMVGCGSGGIRTGQVTAQGLTFCAGKRSLHAVLSTPDGDHSQHTGFCQFIKEPPHRLRGRAGACEGLEPVSPSLDAGAVSCNDSRNRHSEGRAWEVRWARAGGKPRGRGAASESRPLRYRQQYKGTGARARDHNFKGAGVLRGQADFDGNQDCLFPAPTSSRNREHSRHYHRRRWIVSKVTFYLTFC